MKKPDKRPGTVVKVLIVAALVIVVGVVIIAKHTSTSETVSDSTESNISTAPDEQGAAVYPEESVTDEAPSDSTTKALPKLVDLGSKSCVPCKMMEPILENLRKEYAEQFETVVIDVWKNKAAAKQYDIRVIPTQIFFDAEGKELFRHEGFLSKEEILAKWAELGFDFEHNKNESMSPGQP